MTIYKNRYQAQKAYAGDEVIVKVCGGYTVMTYDAYVTWKKQK